MRQGRGITIIDSSVNIDSFKLSRFDVGFYSKNSDFTIENAQFDDVGKAWEVDGGNHADVRESKVSNDPKAHDSDYKRTVSGWRRRGPPLPATCPRCHSIFASKNYDFNTPIFMIGDGKDVCFHCGFEEAVIASGLYNLSGDVAFIIASYDRRPDILREINSVGLQYLHGEISEKILLKRYRLIDFRLYAAAKSALRLDGPAVKFLAFAASIGAFALAVRQTTLAEEQTALAREQTQIAREQAKDSPNSETNILLKEMLEELQKMRFQGDELKRVKPLDQTQKAGESPTACDPKPKPSPAQIKNKRSSKAREIRRREQQERRTAFSPRNRTSSKCD